MHLARRTREQQHLLIYVSWSFKHEVFHLEEAIYYFYQNCNVHIITTLEKLCHIWSSTNSNVVGVIKSYLLEVLEACFDLISSPSLSNNSMKNRIMGGKITENLGFKSLLRKVKNFLSFFLFIFKFSKKTAYQKQRDDRFKNLRWFEHSTEFIK